MPNAFQPLIRDEDDFKAMRAIPTHGLPATFDEWRHERDREATQLAARGFVVRQIEVNAGDFAWFCTRRGYAANLQAIKAFAAEKGARQPSTERDAGDAPLRPDFVRRFHGPLGRPQRDGRIVRLGDGQGVRWRERKSQSRD
jgi:hypothetical protein